MRDQNLLSHVLENQRILKYWSDIFDWMHSEEIPFTWDYQWVYACWAQNGLSIVPKVNMVSNLGFGHAEATNTTNGDNESANLSVEPMSFPLHHPQFMIRNREFDLFIDTNWRSPDLLTRVKSKTKRTINKYYQQLQLSEL